MFDLLMVMTDPPPAADDAFNRWYDDHARARLEIPGIHTAQRYRATPGTQPMYMAWYDLDSTAVLDQPAYTVLRSNRPPGELEMIDSLPAPLDRRIYRGMEEFVSGDFDPESASACLAVWMSTEAPDELDRWYREEHVPMLFKAPGWLRCRRYELDTGAGPRHLALHDLAEEAVVAHPYAEAARHTEWRRRVVEARTSYERRLYRRIRRFE